MCRFGIGIGTGIALQYCLPAACCLALNHVVLVLLFPVVVVIQVVVASLLLLSGYHEFMLLPFTLLHYSCRLILCYYKWSDRHKHVSGRGRAARRRMPPCALVPS